MGFDAQLTQTGKRNVRTPMHDYKSLRVSIMMCATLVNRQTHSQFLTSSNISSASWAQNTLKLRSKS